MEALHKFDLDFDDEDTESFSGQAVVEFDEDYPDQFEVIGVEEGYGQRIRGGYFKYGPVDDADPRMPAIRAYLAKHESDIQDTVFETITEEFGAAYLNRMMEAA